MVIQHYLPLFGLLASGVIGILFFSYDWRFQSGVAIATAAGYVVWGVVHHYLHRDLHLSVIIEYVVVAALGLVVVLSLLIQA